MPFIKKKKCRNIKIDLDYRLVVKISNFTLMVSWFSNDNFAKLIGFDKGSCQTND